LSSLKTNKIFCVVGTRPEFIKLNPIITSLKASEHFQPLILNTRQHQDDLLNKGVLNELGLKSDIILDQKFGSRKQRNKEIISQISGIIDRYDPCGVLVVGDVDSSLVGARACKKKNVPLIHIEAGLRSFDKDMPEEHNRVEVDRLSKYLFTTEPQANKNIEHEFYINKRTHFVGHVVVDMLKNYYSSRIPSQNSFLNLKIPLKILTEPGYGVLTLHRCANIDDPRILRSILEGIKTVGKQFPIVFPIHPKTHQRIKEGGLSHLLSPPEIYTCRPLSFLEMLGLLEGSKLLFTDSGGLQEESAVLGLPCITLRENTERPITCSNGTNMLVGMDSQSIVNAARMCSFIRKENSQVHELWDGNASKRIVNILEKEFVSNGFTF